MKELNFYLINSKEDYEALRRARELFSTGSEALHLAEEKAGYGKPVVSIVVKGDFEDDYVFGNEDELRDFWDGHFFGRHEYLSQNAQSLLDYFVSRFRAGFTGIVLAEFVG